MVERQVREWIHIHIPQWSSLKVQSSLEYLGYWMGPQAGEKTWAAPTCKWIFRTRKIKESRAPPVVRARMYNIRAAPCVGYVAQLADPRLIWEARTTMQPLLC